MRRKKYIDYRYCIFPALTKDIYKLIKKCRRKELELDRQDRSIKPFDWTMIDRELEIIFSK